MDNNITLREYFDEKFNNIGEALKLQAVEYERRLALLNHEADQLKSMQNTYVPRETHDIFVKSVTENLRNLELSRAELSGKASQQSLIFTTAIALIGAVIGIISLIKDIL